MSENHNYPSKVFVILDEFADTDFSLHYSEEKAKEITDRLNSIEIGPPKYRVIGIEII